jgi:hypothetical protein
MTLRAYLSLMIMATLLSAGVFGVAITVIDPYQTNLLGFALFYASLFLTVMGVAAIIGFFIRFIVLRKHLAGRAVTVSFRQAFLIAFLVIASLVLLAHKLFSWFNVLLLIIVFSTLEFFLISLSSEKN